MKLKKKCSSLIVLSLIISGVATTNMSYASSQNATEQQKIEFKSQEDVKVVMEKLQANISENGFKHKENEDLSLDEIRERMLKIDKKYKLNDILSESDSEFIIAYSESINNIQSQDTRAINSSAAIKPAKDTVGGVTAQLTGSLKHSGGTISGNNSFGGTLNLKILGGASKVSSVTGTIYHSGYGVLGSNGVIGKVYAGEITETWSKPPFASNSMTNRTRNYSAIIVAMSTHAEMVIKGPGLNFDLQGGIN